MKQIKNKVIVWSIDDFNTLGLMRQLGQPNIDLLFLIKGNAGMATKSKYCKQYVECPDLQSCYEYLMEAFKNEEYKPILISSGDDSITFIDQHKSEMEKYFILPGTSKQGDVEKYIDKNVMTALAEELGIKCPRSRLVTKESDLSGWTYPCFIKPSHQKPGHYNEFKFKKCNSEKQLKSIMKYVRPDSEFILQEYVNKGHDLLIYGARLKDGKTVTAGAFIRDRMADSGSFSHGIFIDHQHASDYFNGDLFNQIDEFLTRIDYYGLFSFEYGLVGKEPYFFEVNLRNDGTSHYHFQAGANIPLAYVYSCAGMDYSQVSTRIENGRFFIDELFDIENVFHGRINRKQWKKDMQEATIFKYYDKDDIEPYNFVKKGKWKQIFQDLLLMKYRVYIVYLFDKLGLRK